MEKYNKFTYCIFLLRPRLWRKKGIQYDKIYINFSINDWGFLVD